jgi:hypothetical protein
MPKDNVFRRVDKEHRGEECPRQKNRQTDRAPDPEQPGSSSEEGDAGGKRLRRHQQAEQQDWPKVVGPVPELVKGLSGREAEMNRESDGSQRHRREQKDCSSRTLGHRVRLHGWASLSSTADWKIGGIVQ